MAGDAINEHLLMIAAHGMEPRFPKPIQYIQGVRASVDEVAHRKDAVCFGIEIYFAQGFFQKLEMSVNVAHYKVTTFFVGWEGFCREHF
ncbi:hypothetical protein SAMN03159443_00338 [Pseudomonas sp. NFACC15-1]|nr:hypothetical protein SAMN03159443_00338 [Pseudomonas sp. NFACC15-1]SDW34204.1 hypothetical protein SAMN03159380_00507 [Pseudomonas sp. NFACC14]SFA74878.1 hypothetical protein SAMN03159488_00330 [Pseudomonas sp. NFIX10]SFE01115.1 hypothetical protein SAMN03159367_00032 [Pseudomonas sp. NFACC06-1]